MKSLNKVKRIVHRCCEEVDATKKISSVMSPKEGIETFRAKIDMRIMNHNGGYENKTRKNHLLRKHDIMIRYYEKTFGDFLKTYDYAHTDANYQKSKYSNCIWVCWWQGLENAPDIVKACIESIQKNAGNHPVIVLTDENYKQYVTIPRWVEEKRSKGIITRTNYSDLLRLSLLAEHGGMWLDATFFCTDPVLDSYFQKPLWSIKRPDYFHASAACGYFAGYSLACNESNRFVFATIRDFFLNYWKNNNTMVDYLMVDYMIVLAQKYDRRIAEEFAKIEPNNSKCDELVKVLGKPYDENKWQELKKETSLFKLTWKQKYMSEANGETTFYKYLIDRIL